MVINYEEDHTRADRRKRSVYFLRLAQQLSPQEVELHLIASQLGEKVLQYEAGVYFRIIKLWSQTAPR
jgi:3-polyprenyl-4-hydroxybenzoate decarboxylase